MGDWEWPVRDGGKEDRMKLIRYARQIKIAVGEEVVFRANRNKRDSPVEDEEVDYNDHEIDEDDEEEAERQQEEETIKETVSSSTSEKVEFSSEISSPES